MKKKELYANILSFECGVDGHCNPTLEYIVQLGGGGTVSNSL